MTTTKKPLQMLTIENKNRQSENPDRFADAEAFHMSIFAFFYVQYYHNHR